GQLLGLLHAAQAVAPLDRRRLRSENRGQRLAHGGLRLPRQQPLGVGQRGEELGLSDQELGERIAAGADLDEAEEEIRVTGEKLHDARARPGGRQESLELVQRLVRIGTLPERVEQQRIEARERRIQVRRVRDQQPAFEDQLQVVTRALGVLESSRAQRRQARQAELPARRELAIGEELAER